jgi:hypothetical protein
MRMTANAAERREPAALTVRGPVVGAEGAEDEVEEGVAITGLPKDDGSSGGRLR